MQSEIKLIEGIHKIEIKFPIDFELSTNAVAMYVLFTEVRGISRKLGFYM